MNQENTSIFPKPGDQKRVITQGQPISILSATRQRRRAFWRAKVWEGWEDAGQ